METAFIFVNKFFDILWIPLPKTPSYVDIVIISAISAIILLLIFKKTSNQKMLKHHKNVIVANILQIRLYKNQLITTNKSLLNVLLHNIIYLKYTLIPLVFISIPAVIVTVQLNNRYGHVPFEINKSFLIRVDLDKTQVSNISRSLEDIWWTTSSGILVEKYPVRIISEGSILWRGKVVDKDTTRETLRIGFNGRAETLEKVVYISNNKQGISPVTGKWEPLTFLVRNAEGFLPKKSSFKAVSLSYDRATHHFLFWKTDSLILYFIFTLIFGFAFKTLIKVTI